MAADPAAAIPDLYERTAQAWAAARGQALYAGEYSEAEWLDAFTAPLPPGASILDVGCGNGSPIARELLRRGYEVTGVDSSPSLIAMAERDLPDGRWLVGDMRALELERTYEGVLAWHSAFHLSEADQRETLPRLARHVAPGGRLMITTGPVAGIAMGEWQGEPLFHASLSPEEYRNLFARSGLQVDRFTAGMPIVGMGPTVWIAVRPD